jgi:hypothetical protein
MWGIMSPRHPKRYGTSLNDYFIIRLKEPLSGRSTEGDEPLGRRDL